MLYSLFPNIGTTMTHRITTHVLMAMELAPTTKPPSLESGSHRHISNAASKKFSEDSLLLHKDIPDFFTHGLTQDTFMVVAVLKLVEAFRNGNRFFGSNTFSYMVQRLLPSYWSSRSFLSISAHLTSLGNQE